MSVPHERRHVLVDQEGTRRPVRWEFTPEAGKHVLPDAEREAAGPDHLTTGCG